MAGKERLRLSEYKPESKIWYEPIINILVYRRHWTVLAVVLVTAVLAWFAPGMEADVTLKSGINTDSDEYRRYLEFVKVFGTEEYVLIAIKRDPDTPIPIILKALAEITSKLENADKITEVVSLANIRVFQQRKNLFGTYRIVLEDGGELRLPEKADLDRIRKGLPIVDMLLSQDHRTFGLLVSIDEKFTFDPPAIEKILDKMDAVIKESVPKGTQYRIVGASVIRKAIQKYNIRTAITFGLLCVLISTAVSYYIFKSLRAMFITVLVVVLCDLWIIGVMSILQIPINSTTALAFGLVLISSVEPVIHLVTHFNECLREGGDRVAAAKESLMIGAGPCLVTSFTTAFGFSSLIVASMPMVRQLGVILSLGPLVAFVLSVVLTPALLTAMKPLKKSLYERMSGDLVQTGFVRAEGLVFRHHKLCMAVIFVIIGVMLAGAPRIRSDTQILRMLTDSTPEMEDIRFVESSLGPVNFLELVLEAEPNAFKDPEVWKKVRDVEQRLGALPEVIYTDSLLSLLEYLHGLGGESGGKQEDLLANPEAVPQLLAMTSMSTEGKKVRKRFVDEGLSQLHISVRIKNSPNTTISETIQQIKSVAQSGMKGTAKVFVTGDLAVFEAQATDIVSSQTYSLLLAVFYMSVLLGIQFRSIALGLASLFPQILPQAVIFGTMGWLGISLDSVTVFAASVSIGLTVDNTVHYLTQMQREIKARGKDLDIKECIAAAYQVTARAMISNHAVIFFGFVMLLISPFRPVICFGILGSLAIGFSLVGDLIFMPSVILSSRLFRKMLGENNRANS